MLKMGTPAQKPEGMRPAWLWLLGTAVLASIHCQPLPALEEKGLGVPPGPQDQLSEPGPAYQQVTPVITDFALRLYRQLAAETTGNICFSPVSLSTTLALFSLGAPADTTVRILEGLGFNLTETPEADIHHGFQSLLHALGQPSSKLELKAGSSLLLHKQLKPRQSFLEAARELYGALAFSANFSEAKATRRQMEAHVRRQTYGRVVGGLQAFSVDTLMVLLNHLFFKAKWKLQFNRPNPQKPGSFSTNGKPHLHIPMMHQKELHRFLYDPELACTVLQLDCSGNARALLVLPDPGKMGQLEATLQPKTLRKWDQLLLPSLLDLHLPRFFISGSYSLGDILTHVGLNDIFSSETNLSGIAGQLNRTISRVSHKAVLDVTERGTEAGVASILLTQTHTLNATSSSLNPTSSTPLAHFNRPFLVLLWEVTTESLLFMGKVVNPAMG